MNQQSSRRVELLEERRVMVNLAATQGLDSYPAYRPSGIPWLGEVPEHWGVRRLKAVCQLVYGDSLPADARGHGIVPVFGSNGQVGMHTEANTGAPCIVVGRKGSFGKVHYSERPVFAIDTTYYVDERHTTAKLPWLSRVLSWLQLDAVTRDSAIPGLNREEAYDRLLPLPPLPEQRAIDRYLDYVDRRIRRYVRAKRKLIALLEEERKAIVNRAVTRGLDPNVRLKPSGVEWLGDVPEHWEISRVKTEFHSLNHRRVPLSAVERGAMSVRRYDYYGASGVIDKVEDYLFDDNLLLIAEDGANLVLRNLPLAIVARGKFWVNNHAHILKPRRGNLEYLAAVMERLNYTPWISGAAQPKLTQDRLMSIAIAVPPPSEQAEVIDKVTEETAALRHAIARARRQIELVEEYRTRLIADVVTGKLDVREAASQPPNEDDEAETIRENGPLADGQPGDLYSIDESVEDSVMEEEVTA